MLEENLCPPADRYLMVIGQYSLAAQPRVLASVRKYFQQNQHRFDQLSASTMEQFLAFARNFGGLVLQTCYCHADVVRGRSFDVVFDLYQPENFVLTKAVVQYSVLFGEYAISGLTHGWHQAAYFEFPCGVPSLVSALPIDEFPHNQGIAFCDSENWEVIAEQIQNSRTYQLKQRESHA